MVDCVGLCEVGREVDYNFELKCGLWQGCVMLPWLFNGFSNKEERAKWMKREWDS